MPATSLQADTQSAGEPEEEQISLATRLAINLGRIAVALVVPILTFIGLWQGFIFLRDSEAPQLIITAVAIVWGVGGVAMLYFVSNWLVEQLSDFLVKRIQPFVFVGPAMAILIWYLTLPTLRSFWLSLRNANGSVFIEPIYRNYRDIFTNRIMLEALRNTILWMVFGTAIIVALALLIAILADRSKFERVAKALIFLPMAISFVGAGVIWNFIYDYDPKIGLLNAIWAGIGNDPVSWTRTFQPWNNLFLVIILIWMQTGFAMVLISAAIKGVPDDLLEAARVDGATEIQIFFRIIIPYIQGTLITVTTTIMIFALKTFDAVMATTGGQFGTEVIGVRFYRELFNNQDSGRGSAIAILLLVAIIPVMVYNLRQFREREAF